jgi:hypothetical protein
MVLLTLQLILAHILGDFVFQPSKWVADKNEKKQLSKYLYAHILIHAIALLFILQFNWNYWAGILIILVSHFVIDLIKVNLKGKINTSLLFILDQIAHLAIIALVVYFYTPYYLDWQLIFSSKTLLLATCIILVTNVSSILMQIILIKWRLEEDDNTSSLENAGKYIGMLERLFVFVFIITNQWQAIGFLLAAKSVFRFGDLSNAKDRKLTEYILIGTLLSFGLAIAIGLLFQYASTKIVL